MSETTTEERVQDKAVEWFEGMSALDREEAGKLPASSMRGMLELSATRYRRAAAALREQPDLRALVEELAALPTVGEWLETDDRDVDSDELGARLDALILRARTLTGD